MKPETIMKSFQATGVWPMDGEAVLKRFDSNTLEEDEDTQIRQHGDGDSWTQLRIFFDAAVADKTKVEAIKLPHSIHSLQVNNELLRQENLDPQEAITTKRNHKKKSNTLDLQQRQEYHGGAVFWSQGSSAKPARVRPRNKMKPNANDSKKLTIKS
jgi:hypothetical protein